MAGWVGNVACIGEETLEKCFDWKTKRKEANKGACVNGEVSNEMYCMEIGQDGFDLP